VEVASTYARATPQDDLRSTPSNERFVRHRTEFQMNQVQPANMPEHATTSVDLSSFTRPSTPRALWQLTNTLLPYISLWTLMAWSWKAGWNYGWTLALAVPTAAFYVRLFILQHDCGHGSLFANRHANRWVGAMLGLLTLFPFAYWKKTHDLHHATSGNLDKRLLGDIRTLTVAEYRSGSFWRRLGYRLYRSMPVMLLIGPIYQFVAKHRLPVGMPLRWKREWRSVGLNNLALLAVASALGLWLGWPVLLAVQLPIVALAGAAGVWLFYVQHNFDGGYWTRRDDWDPYQAAVIGSSFYDLPPVLRWFTANIGYHHIHHLSPRIPNYRLRAAHAAASGLPGLRRMNLRESLSCSRFKLWCEDTRRMVGYPVLPRTPSKRV
jgi:omega-6 fatty acid desaturase (delta-12 desaturase)